MQKENLEPLARRICEERGLRLVDGMCEGSFKQTFKVIGEDGVPIALKIYKSSESDVRDEREINTMLRCDHPSIAKILTAELYEYSDSAFTVVTEEYLDGGTLSSRDLLTPDKCYSMGNKLINILVYLSSMGLVHRDIKPDNILFRENDGNPVLTDFGIVKDLGASSLTSTSAIRGPGTPFFASPEQLNNQKDLTDWRCDQFSLGITLSFKLFGIHPYQVPNMQIEEVVDRVSLRHRPDPSFRTRAKESGLPALYKMVQPWPVDRFRRPEQLAQEWMSQKG